MIDSTITETEQIRQRKIKNLVYAPFNLNSVGLIPTSANEE